MEWGDRRDAGSDDGGTPVSGNRKDDWCDQEELAVGWAMHALEPDEEGLVRSHLPGCARCQRVVRSTEEVAAALGASVRQYEPPARLRARLMAAIEHTPQETPAPTVVTVPSRQEMAEPISLDARRRNPVKRARYLLAAAVLILVAVVSGVVGQRFSALSDQVTAQSNRTDLIEGVMRLAADPVTNRAVLRTDSGEPFAVLLSGTDDAVVMPMKLRPNDVTKEVYVVWGTSGGTVPVPLTTFDVRAGADVGFVDWSTSAHAHNGFAVSLEQGRSAPAAPLSRVIAAGQVAVA